MPGIGTITGLIKRFRTDHTRPQVATIVLTCTASVDDASYPITVINSLLGIVDYDLRGLKLYSIKQVPGLVPPTAASDLTLTDEYGIDLLAGNGVNFISHTTPSRYVVDTALAFIITGDITATITGNSVNSAVFTLVLDLIGC